MNKIVLNRRVGDVMKGSTGDFRPNNEKFHIALEDGSVTKVSIADLKAVFFVRDMEGHPDRQDRYEDDIRGAGRKLQVTFEDGEVIVGFSSVYKPDRQGWFMVPADNQSNNLRIFVVNSAVAEVTLID